MALRAIIFFCASVARIACADDTLSLLQTHVERALDEEANRPMHAGKQASRSKAAHASSSIVRLLDFTKAELVFNNLGGQGPVQNLPGGDEAPRQMRFRNLVRGQPVDLMITAGEGYTAHNSKRNGILGGNAQLNIKSGSSVDLTYTFVDEGTNNPHMMPEFYMTFSDVDERHGGKEKEKITVDGFTRFYTNDDLQLEDPNYIANGHQPAFVSSDFGNYADNDFSPDSPEPIMLSHAVTYLFLNKSSFHVTFSSNHNFKTGRNVLFSGISQLVFCQEPSTYLDFKGSTVSVNNLGGLGPMDPLGYPAEVRYSGIANTSDGTILDLVVTSDDTYGYQASNISQNGLHGDFGIVNLFCGETHDESEAWLTFTIVKSGTNNPYQVNAFAFTVFDFDTGLHEQQVEYVDMKQTAPGFDAVGSGYASYIVTSTTELEVMDVPADDESSADVGWKRFSATKHGTEADNPGSSQMLAREVADKSVVFTFRKTSRWRMTLGIKATGFDSGRNFMFAGQDMYLMCD